MKSCVLFLLLLNVGCVPPASEDERAATGLEDSTCPGPYELHGEGVGEIQIGRDLDETMAACPTVADSVVEDAEAMPQREVVFRLGEVPVIAETDDHVIWRIRVRDPRLHTSDGLGVGTRLEELRQTGGMRGLLEQGRVYATTATHCGISFQLEDVAGEAWPGKATLTEADMASLPGSLTVEEVLIFGCDR